MDDLANAPALLARLSSDLHTCEDRLSHLHSTIVSTLAAWACHSQSMSSSLSSVSRKLEDFAVQSPTHAPAATATATDPAAQGDFVGQLPMLAAEVARIERVRLYAEISLRLEALVGDLEDAVASVVIGAPRIQLPRKMANSPAPDVLVDLSSKFATATNALKKIEDVIVKATTSWPQWKRLLMAVDIRIDSALASLRPSAIADYRSKLAAIGWPPPLSAGVVQEGGHKDAILENPLLRLHGEMKGRFEESFVSLSSLQALQCRHKARQSVQFSHKSHGVVDQVHDHELLWTVDELVAPIGSRAAHHFLKWSEKPDLIFGLAYRVAQQHIETVDMVLQPMLDRVRLAGYCVREEWISAIITMVINHLGSYTLAELAVKLSEDVKDQEAASLWLHMVDLAISFDKKMRSLALQSVGPLTSKVDLDPFEESDTDLQSTVKCVSVFAERREWLELWAHLELCDAQEKLNRELQKESVWLPHDPSDMLVRSALFQSDFVLENYRHPQAAEATMLKMWALINRCRSLPQPNWQLAFITHVGAPFMKCFLANLFQRCQEAEAMTALAEEGAVLKVASCISAGCFCEHKLQEWSEDVFFLDLRRVQVSSADDESKQKGLGWTESEENLSSVQGSVFDEEITCLVQFRTEWIQKLVSATQRAFDASCQDYQRNKKRWQDENSVTGVAMDASVSPSLVDALAILQNRLRMLKEFLGDAVFVDFWLSLASSLDQFFLNAVVLGGARFSMYGSFQLAKDIEALFHVFKPVCVRPVSFFPNMGDAALLFTLPQGDVVKLQKILLSTSNWRFRDQGDESRSTSLKEYGIRWIAPGTAGKILSQRFFPKV